MVQEVKSKETMSTTGEAPNPPRTTPAPAETGTSGEARTTPSPADSAGPGLEDLRAQLEEARQRAEQNWDQVLRSRAELENLRRRHERDLEATRKFALDGFVRELLGVWDSLELGLNAANEAQTETTKLREGIELTVKLFENAMGKFGVQAIDPQGQPFNPDLHQAMSMVPRADLPANRVVTVVQKGYSLNGRLVRPAMVLVSQQPMPPVNNSLE